MVKDKEKACQPRRAMHALSEKMPPATDAETDVAGSWRRSLRKGWRRLSCLMIDKKNPRSPEKILRSRTRI